MCCAGAGSPSCSTTMFVAVLSEYRIIKRPLLLKAFATGQDLASLSILNGAQAGEPGHRQAHLEAVPRRRSHGDSTGGQPRPQRGHERSPRQAHVARHQISSGEMIRRRRANTLFMLVVVSAATLFLAATTKAPVMLYLFAASFLALCGYLYLLSQARQRESSAWPNDWMHHR